MHCGAVGVIIDRLVAMQGLDAEDLAQRVPAGVEGVEARVEQVGRPEEQSLLALIVFVEGGLVGVVLGRVDREEGVGDHCVPPSRHAVQRLLSLGAVRGERPQHVPVLSHHEVRSEVLFGGRHLVLEYIPEG